MPDFDKMSDKALREFKSKKHHQMRAIRDEMLEAEKALQKLRAKAYDKERAEAMSTAAEDAVSEAEAIVHSPGADAGAESKQG